MNCTGDGRFGQVYIASSSASVILDAATGSLGPRRWHGLRVGSTGFDRGSVSAVSASGFGDLQIAARFESGQAIVSVRGEVDPLTAPTLTAVCSALVDSGHPGLVLDLADCTFMDASGRRTITETSTLVSAAGGSLAIRHASATVLRILDLTGVSELVQIESDVSGAVLGAEQRPGDASSSVDSHRPELSTDLVRVGSISANSDVVDSALGLVTALASTTVDGADGVSVTLQRRGQFTTVASSNDTVLRMDRHQYDTGEGPCLDAATEGHWFHIESLAAEDRWPSFSPRAMEEGIASILSTPLLAGDRSIGALNIYSNTDGAFGARQQELAALFATQASKILGDAGADVTDGQLEDRIAGALAGRQVLAQAQGMIMLRRQVTAEAATAVLQRDARAAGLPVLQYASQYANEIVTPPGSAELEG